MKNIFVTAILILSAAPVTSFAASAVEEGKALEAKMDAVKPNLSDAKTAEAQDELAADAADFVKKYLKKNADAQTFEAACRIFVRGSEYDRQDYIGELNHKQIVQNGDRIDKTFLKFEAEKQFDRKDLERLRPNYRTPKRDKASDGAPTLDKKDKAAPAKKSAAAKPAAKAALPASENLHADDGAALPKCLKDGKCPSKDPLIQFIAKALGISKQASQEQTFSSYDPSPKKR